MGEALRGQALADRDDSRELAVFVCERAGLTGAVDRRQTWRVGEHELLVALKLDERYRYYLRVLSGWPNVPARRGLKLGHVFAIAVTGDLRELKGPERARWKLRALVEAGLVELPAVSLRALPERAPDAARRTWDAVRHLAAIRAITDGTGPLPLSAPWLAKWSGLDESVLRSGKRWLENEGYLRRAGEVARKPKPLILWSLALVEDVEP